MKANKCCITPYRKVTHVIFDLDGTILDTETLIEHVLKEICLKYDKTFPPRLHAKTAGAVVEDIAKLLIKELDLPMTVAEFRELYRELTVTRCSDIKFMPGAEELIRHFYKNKVPIAVATSSAEDLMFMKTQAHKRVFEFFHHIVCGGSDPEVKAGKPAPDIFLVCASRFPDNPDPRDCLVLEDAPNGIQGALKAGMQAVMIPQDDVPYSMWKQATLRLDSLEYMAPELFGLPPMIIKSSPLPKISFTMYYDGEGKKTEKKEESDKNDEEGKSVEVKQNEFNYDDGKGKESDKGRQLETSMFEKMEYK